MYYLFKKYSLNISVRSIQVLTPTIQFDNSFTQTWKHLRHFLTIWMTLMTSEGSPTKNMTFWVNSMGNIATVGKQHWSLFITVMEEANQKKKLNFLLSLTFSLKFPQSEDEMEMRRSRASSNCGKNPDLAWISRLLPESTLNGDPWTFYNPHAKAVWLRKIARNLVSKFSFKDMSHSNPNKDLRGHEET